MHIYNFIKHVDWNLILSIIAIFISAYSLYTSNKLEKKNLTLSIRQKLYDVSNERAKECNKVWNSELKGKSSLPYYNTISELVITIEILERSFSLFQLGKRSKIVNKTDFYYIVWKQLSTDLRGFIEKVKEGPEYSQNKIYKSQVDGIHSFFSMYFEGKPLLRT